MHHRGNTAPILTAEGIAQRADDVHAERGIHEKGGVDIAVSHHVAFKSR